MDPQDKKQMKVLFIASWYPNREHAVDGIFIKRHAIAVSKYCDVAVLNVHLGTIEDGIDVSKDKGILEVTVYRKLNNYQNKLMINLSQVVQYLEYFLGALRGYDVIEKEFGKPDLVHCNVIIYAGIFSFYLKMIYNIRYIITEHWTGYLAKSGIFNNSSIFRKNLTRVIGKRAIAITTVSGSLRDAMIKCGIDNDYFVIPNVAQVDDRNCCKTQKDPKQILHISLLKDDIKNVSGILSAIKKISLRRNDFELHIIGNGLDRKQLQSIAEDYGLLNKVVFFEGMLDDNELSKFFFDCDFFVLNSNYETFSVVTAEALSCGKPVIATKCGGPEEFVNEKCGILIEPKDEDALVIAIDYMLDNFSNYNSNGIREYAANKFGYDAVGKAFLQLYQKVIK